MLFLNQNISNDSDGFFGGFWWSCYYLIIKSFAQNKMLIKNYFTFHPCSELCVFAVHVRHILVTPRFDLFVITKDKLWTYQNRQKHIASRTLTGNRKRERIKHWSRKRNAAQNGSSMIHGWGPHTICGGAGRPIGTWKTTPRKI